MEGWAKELSKWAATFGVLFLTIIGVTIGRASHWANIKKRMPTLKEFLIEPIIIIFMSVLAAACLRWSGIDDPLILVGLSSPFGHYGPRAVDFIIKCAGKKLGLNTNWYLCPTDLIILSEAEKQRQLDSKDENIS